jgi:hypothetical protein
LTGTVADPGLIAIDTRVAVVTVTAVAALLPLKVAVIVEVPALTPVTTPLVGATVAIAAVALVQLAVVLTSRVEPSLKVATATKACTPLVGTDAVVGVTATDTTVGAGALGGVASWPPPPPHAANRPLNSRAMNHARKLDWPLNVFIQFLSDSGQTTVAVAG